jgi:bifunctional non-homologous end joining protein LigD
MTSNGGKVDGGRPDAFLEPDVDPLTAPVGTSFVIQQHHATRLHHDVRLEMMSGDTPVLVSWAVPKGLPRRRGDRHLAIRTPDHAMEWGGFSGSIPEDEYGGGDVRIFDRGRYEMTGRTDDRLTFRLEGERLTGIWHLVHTGVDKGKDQWLAIMSKDMRRKPDEWPPLKPMLATLTDAPFDDEAWGFEPKWDGIRALAICNEETRLITRNDRDVTVAYPELQRLHEQTVALDALLDGEIVAFESGVPSFQRLQQRMHLRDEHKIKEMARQIPVVYMIFDLIYLDGRDLTGETLQERRRIMEESIVPSEQIQVSPSTQGAGTALFEAAAAQGLEGIMAKRLSSIYVPGGRSKDWLKVKVKFDADVVIVGWTEGEKARAGTVGSLVMAMYDDGRLRYVGNVGTGFGHGLLEETMERLSALEETEAWFTERAELRRAHWVPPVLVAKVEHRGVTSAGRLRAPSFQDFREDKRPEECTVDQLSVG